MLIYSWNTQESKRSQPLGSLCLWQCFSQRQKKSLHQKVDCFSPPCLASELSISCWAGASQLFGQLFPPGFCKCHRWLTTERDFQFLICKSYSFPKYWLRWQWRWRKFRYFSGQWRGLSVDSPSHATTTEECQRETINQNHQNHSACAKYSFLRKGKHHKHSLSRKTISSIVIIKITYESAMQWWWEC